MVAICGEIVCKFKQIDKLCSSGSPHFPSSSLFWLMLILQYLYFVSHFFLSLTFNLSSTLFYTLFFNTNVLKGIVLQDFQNPLFHLATSTGSLRTLQRLKKFAKILEVIRILKYCVIFHFEHLCTVSAKFFVLTSTSSKGTSNDSRMDWICEVSLSV